MDLVPLSKLDCNLEFYCLSCFLTLAAYATGLNLGSGVTAFSLAPEILPQSARPGGMGVALLCHWLGFFVVSFITPYMFVSKS